jgi:hypothetical protein
LYDRASLDAWALAKIGPLRTSTSHTEQGMRGTAQAYSRGKLHDD